jgi:hypothetical protein
MPHLVDVCLQMRPLLCRAIGAEAFMHGFNLPKACVGAWMRTVGRVTFRYNMTVQTRTNKTLQLPWKSLYKGPILSSFAGCS